MRQIKQQSPDEPAFKKFFMHGLGHPLGLDVHDVGLITEPIQAGWVMTVEPAIYIQAEEMAVRLENDVLVTESGPVDLMQHIPIEPEHIEELMNSRPSVRSHRGTRSGIHQKNRLARISSHGSGNGDR
jgi:Xaa-Pro aminopeptidase